MNHTVKAHYKNYPQSTEKDFLTECHYSKNNIAWIKKQLVLKSVGHYNEQRLYYEVDYFFCYYVLYIFQTFLECVRLRTFSKFGLQQAQVDIHYLQLYLWHFVADEK